MPLNSWLRNKLGRSRYSYEGKGSILYDSENKSATKIGKKNIDPLAWLTPKGPSRVKHISSGRENEISMKMFKKKSKIILPKYN
jgi:hypothetical protein